MLLPAGALLGILLASLDDNDRDDLDARPTSSAGVAAALHVVPTGTSGELEHGGIVREIETITGVNDGMTLVGRRVDLHVDVQGRATDTAFWVGSRDNRVLVVMTRSAPVRRGQRAAISGSIRAMPAPGALAGWNLSAEDKAELAERKIYIRADSVTSEGHGTY